MVGRFGWEGRGGDGDSDADGDGVGMVGGFYKRGKENAFREIPCPFPKPSRFQLSINVISLILDRSLFLRREILRIKVTPYDRTQSGFQSNDDNY